MGEPEALRLDDVGLRTPEGQVILEGVSWRLQAGGTAVLVGPSGSGKSRLLRLLNRLDEPTRGRVEVLGRPQSAWDVRALRQSVLLVGQRPALQAGSVRQCLELPVRLGLLTPQQQAERLGEALATACVPTALLERDSAQLSGGERGRVALARGLLLQPRVLLLDEPTSALDPPTAEALVRGLVAWQGRTGAALVLVTHRLAETQALSGQGLVLCEGRVEEQGELRAVLSAAQSPKARAFLGLARSEGAP